MIGSETFIIVALRWMENEHALLLGVLDLRLEEAHQRRAAHEGAVDHLAGLERDLVLQDRDRCRSCR